MSTVHPPIPAHQSTHPMGFNDQTCYDPFIPSSPDDEQLVPIGSDPSPSHYSYHTLSPTQTPKPNDSTLQSPPPPIQDYDHLQLPSQSALTNGVDSSYSPRSEFNAEIAGSNYDFLSPNTYISDNGYNASSEHTTTPDLNGNGFYLEDNYGILVDPNQSVDLNDSNSLLNSHLNGVPPSSQSDSHHHPTWNRNSAGAATLSSHLMSPVLTDSSMVTSRHGTNSPPEDKNHIKSESPENAAAASFFHNVHQGAMAESDGTIRITPSLTESSKATSPEMSFVAPDIARAVSPIIRVDGYSRGDSPARAALQMPRNNGKCSRAGSNTSHLTVQQDSDSKEDEKCDDYFSGTQGTADPSIGRSGLDPKARNQISDSEIPTLREQETHAQVMLKNMDVAEWLDRSEPGSEENADAPPCKPAAISKRQRAKSTGAQTLSYANLENLQATNADMYIPGPGVLINEESGDDEYDEDGTASIEDSPPPTTAQGEPVNDRPGNAKPGVYDELSNQPPLYRAKLWQDSLYDSSDPGVKMQPETANAAMVRYQQRAGDIETLSRVATWGTRRMSESDLNSLFHRFSVSEKSQGPVKEKRDRRGSFLQQLSGRLSSKRSQTNLRRQDSDKSTKPKDKPVRSPPQEHTRNNSNETRKDSLGVPQGPPSGLKRMSSLGKRPKSPRINTGNAVAAMAFQASALGAAGTVSATATSSPTSWPKNIMRRSRSRSELNNTGLPASGPSSSAEQGQPGLTAMWTKQGGPPMPTLATPLKNEDTFDSLGDGEDDEENDVNEDHGVTMDLSVRPDSIVPTLEGFKANVRHLNPRLPAFMFERIAQEQLRRFKKLLDFKIKHIQALSLRKCVSGKHCTELGGEPTYLPSRSSGREQESNNTGFTMAGLGQSDEDVNALAEGIVTPAQFPPGVPMPPVKRLPAEFECSLCFRVKKFYKPSDWSKHVHEDVQPFTCTFATCAEPKSFKRKADWVRHENERHRQLEWWMCNLNDCSHKCYRKDNFVQHLVREHKLPEPKVKTTKVGKPAVRGPSSQKARIKQGDDTEDSTDEIDQVWKLVDECRHETQKNPKEEACKFCGNVCNSWKKLTVHLAKHMEQISMPVLEVVKQKDVTPETIISPIEQGIAPQQNSISPTVQSPFSQNASTNSVSPYRMPVSGVGELPGAFTSLQPQSGYMGRPTPEQQSANYPRMSPNTYPPPAQAPRLGASYIIDNQGSHYASNYNSYTGSPASQFNPVSADRSFPHPQTSSPSNMYSGNAQAPTSQPRASPYDSSNAFQYFPQQQQVYSSPTEGKVFQYGNAAPVSSYTQQRTPPQAPTSYPTQMEIQAPSYPQQQVSTSGQFPTQYHRVGQFQSYGHANSDASLYNPKQQQQYSYGQR